MNAAESNAAVEVVAPAAAAAGQYATSSLREDKAVAKDQQHQSTKESGKKKPWYERIKLQPVIYRGKCGM